MGSYSFRSSGTTQAAAAANRLATTAVPVGIITPVSLGSDDLLTTSTDLATQLADNLRNLVLTNWGERLGFYDYGANLRPLVTELVSLDDFDIQAISRIKAAVQRWMPYIDLEDFLSSSDGTQNQKVATINLAITFNIPSLRVLKRRLQVTLYAA